MNIVVGMSARSAQKYDLQHTLVLSNEVNESLVLSNEEMKVINQRLRPKIVLSY